LQPRVVESDYSTSSIAAVRDKVVLCRDNEHKVSKVQYEEDCLCHQQIELLCGSLSSTVVFHLPLGDHVRHLDAAKQNAGAPEILESEHGPGAPLDRAVVLVDSLVQVLRLADLDGRFALGVDGFQRSQIGATFVDRHRLGCAILGDRFFEIPPCRSLIPMGTQQKIDGVAGLVDGTI
jgi:hypothetical protein